MNFHLQSQESLASRVGSTPSNTGAKSLLDAGPRSSGVSCDTSYAGRPSMQGSGNSRFYKGGGAEGSWMSLQSLRSSLADEPMLAAHAAPPPPQQVEHAVASQPAQREGIPAETSFS